MPDLVQVLKYISKSYTVLVVTNAVPPSSVAGSGILCSLVVLYLGSHCLSSTGPPSLFNSVLAPRCRWTQGVGACVWLSPSDSSRWASVCTSAFWTGSGPGSASSGSTTGTQFMVMMTSDHVRRRKKYQWLWNPK